MKKSDTELSAEVKKILQNIGISPIARDDTEDDLSMILSKEIKSENVYIV